MEVYVGMLLLAGFNFAPRDWAACNGQLLSISDYDVLYSLIGTTYGGDGQTTFGLPDLRGRTPIGMGQLQPSGGNYLLGQSGGAENVTVVQNTYPAHSHLIYGTSSVANSASPSADLFAGGRSIYASNTTPNTLLYSGMVSMSTNGSGPHANLQPYQTLTWLIALYGLYPSPS